MDHMNDQSSMEGLLTANKKRRHPESSSTTCGTSSFLSGSSLEVLHRIEHPNFEELARWNPMFLRAWEATRQQQKETQKPFSACVSQEFTIALTRAILKTHFQLELPHLEDHHLCPPVPNRFFYLHWIHTELLRGDKASSGITRPCWGMDIGSGATAIYSLLAAKFFQWQMFTTEIDANAAAMAQNNIQDNHLSSTIQVALVSPSHSQDPSQPPGGPLERSIQSLEQYLAQPQNPINPTTTKMLDFVMTNPPFYDNGDNQESSVESYKNPRVGDGRARTSMTVSEGCYPGGEIGFVTEMIVDSLRRPHASQWFSSMLGKKTSLLHLQKLLLHVLGPAHVRVTEYGPGIYTRWFLAWTLQRPHALNPQARMKITLSKGADWFLVSLSESDLHGNRPPIDEIISRILAFGQSSPGGWHLSTTLLASNPSSALLQLQEINPVHVQSFVDESDPNLQNGIPQMVLEALQGCDRGSLLPPEGHFVIQVAIEPVTKTTSPQNYDNKNINEWSVHLTGYRHSLRGQTAIKKICSTIEGEICRTNRQWRRKLQRQTQSANDRQDSTNGDLMDIVS